VVDNQPTNNTPVLGPITLAPGDWAGYLGSYPVPINTCNSNISDTVTVRGSDVCTGSNVIVTASSQCPVVPTPRLALTKQCPPNPVAPGSMLVYSGSLSNAGTITITNINVVDDRPSPNTPVLGPITLTPGQFVNFSGSYPVPYDCCGPCVDTLTAVGQDLCAGSNVTATASAACPRVTTPAIRVTRDCGPSPVTEGEMVMFTGSVSNSGNATLGNVEVVDDQAGVVVSSLTLAPMEVESFMGMYIVTNCGPSVPSGVTASGSDVCTGIVVSNRFLTACSVICPTNSSGPVVIFGQQVTEGNSFIFYFDTEQGHTYTVEYSDSLFPANWRTNSIVPGDGNQATISDSITNAHRFYRLLVQ
jgi:hypothetical protein